MLNVRFARVSLPPVLIAAGIVAALVVAAPAAYAQDAKPPRPPVAPAPAVAPAPQAAIPGPAATPQQAPQPPRPVTHEFQIMILKARPGAPAAPELPADAARALEAVRELLPFKNFELLDTGWIRTADAARVRLGDAGSLEVYLRIDGHPRQGARDELLISNFELDARRVGRDEASGEVEYLTDAENLLATSFGVSVGETVVVGTSRVFAEDGALIVLLKAVR